MSDHPTSFRATPELKKALKKEADARKWPVSVLIQDILDRWLQWNKKQGEKK